MRIFSSTLLAVQLFSVAPSVFAATMTSSEDIVMEYAITQGILSTEKDGLQHPEAPLSRIDLVRGIVHNVYEKDVSWECFGLIAPKPTTKYTHLFKDIPKTFTYAQEVCVGMLVGIVQGKEDGNFRPYDGATLSEAAKVISKSYGIASDPGLHPELDIRWEEPYWYALARRNVLPSRIRDQRDAVMTRGEFASIMFGLRQEKPKYGARFEQTQASTDAVSNLVLASTISVPMKVSTPAITEAGNALQRHAAERLEGRLASLQDVLSARQV